MCTALRYKACEGCKEHVRGFPVTGKPGGPETHNFTGDASHIAQRSINTIAIAPVPNPSSSPTSDPVPGSDSASFALVTKAVAVAVAATEDLGKEAVEMDVTASDVQANNNDSKKEGDAMQINQVEVSNQNVNDSQDNGYDEIAKEGGGGGGGGGGLNAADVKPVIKVEVKSKSMDATESDIADKEARNPSFLKCSRCPSVYHHSCALEAMKSDGDSNAVADPRSLPEGGAVMAPVERGWADDGKWICPLCRYSGNPSQDNCRHFYLPLLYCGHITTVCDCGDYTVYFLFGLYYCLRYHI